MSDLHKLLAPSAVCSLLAVLAGVRAFALRRPSVAVANHALPRIHALPLRCIPAIVGCLVSFWRLPGRRFSFLVFLLFFALLCLLPAACSVKEDRIGCPCMVILDLSGLAETAEEGVIVEVQGDDGRSLRDTVYRALFDESYILSVPKGDILLDVYAPLSASMSIALGSECPGIMLYSEKIDARGESVRRTIALHKSWCRINVTLVSAEGDILSPYFIYIEGCVSGYAHGGGLTEGDFSVRLNTDSSLSAGVSVPRQKDGSLVMEIYDDEGSIRTFAIGEYILESGYDWDAEDLEDISITVDFAMTRLYLSYGLWLEEYEFDISI